jgi:hypothetical protein
MMYCGETTLSFVVWIKCITTKYVVWKTEGE